MHQQPPPRSCLVLPVPVCGLANHHPHVQTASATAAQQDCASAARCRLLASAGIARPGDRVFSCWGLQPADPSIRSTVLQHFQDMQPLPRVLPLAPSYSGTSIRQNTRPPRPNRAVTMSSPRLTLRVGPIAQAQLDSTTTSVAVSAHKGQRRAAKT